MESDRLLLQWQDIKYSATNKDKTTTNIVKGISGEVVSGEMIAILGPSGAGKTSFLDILAGRLRNTSSTKVSGTILLNGETPSASKYAKISGYVKQEDLFFASSTVREAITFSARLRLPQSLSDEEVDEQVQKTIDELGLSKVADSKIGGETIRGISGGERKRTAVGVELVRRAKLLFLDEMTTGLDSAMSLTLVSTLRQVASNNRAVVCTIHQPRWSVLRQFDKIMLLAQGNLVYYGPTMKAVEYFTGLGLTIKQFENPGDFFLDHIRVKRGSNVLEYENSVPQEELDRLVNEFKPHNKLAIKESSDISLLAETEIPETANWPTQFRMVLKRGLKAAFTDPLIGTSEIFLYFLMGIIMWLIFWGTNADQEGIQVRIKVVYTVILAAGFTPAFAVVVYFPAERAVFNRERAGRFYSTSAYYAASSLATVPVQLIGSTLLVIMTYWATGLQNTAESFFLFYIIVLVTALLSDALGVAVSSVAPSFGAGNLLAALAIMLWLPFGGVMVTKVHPWLYPFQYTSFFKYSTEAALQNEFTKSNFMCDPTPCPISETVTLGNQTVPSSQLNLECSLPCLFNNYRDLSDFYNLDLLSIGENIAVLISFLIFFRALGYIFMRYLKIGKS